MELCHTSQTPQTAPRCDWDVYPGWRARLASPCGLALSLWSSTRLGRCVSGLGFSTARRRPALPTRILRLDDSPRVKKEKTQTRRDANGKVAVVQIDEAVVATRRSRERSLCQTPSSSLTRRVRFGSWHGTMFIVCVPKSSAGMFHPERSGGSSLGTDTDDQEQPRCLALTSKTLKMQ